MFGRFTKKVDIFLPMGVRALQCMRKSDELCSDSY